MPVDPHRYLIRPERPGEGAAIGRVHTAAFPTAAEARLVDALRTGGRLAISLVAEVSDQLVGHVALSPVRIEHDATAGHGIELGLGLAPLSVLPSWQRRGVGRRLVEAGLSAARRDGWAWVVVLGDPAYYGRCGFAPASGWRLQDAYGGGDAFQALELIPGGIPAGGGRVAYAPEFAGLDEPASET